MKQMKKTAVCMMACALLLGGCAKQPQAKPEDNAADINEFMIKEGVKLTCEMDELAGSQEYIKMMTASEAVNQIVARMAEGEYEQPDHVYVIQMPDDILMKTLEITEDQIDVSKPVSDKLKNKINGSVFANMLNAGYGSDMIAAGAIMNWGESYIQPEGWNANSVLIFEYGGEFSSVVSFNQTGDQVISASSLFIKNGEGQLFQAFQQYLGGSELEVEEFSKSRLEEMLK